MSIKSVNLIQILTFYFMVLSKGPQKTILLPEVKRLSENCSFFVNL